MTPFGFSRERPPVHTDWRAGAAALAELLETVAPMRLMPSRMRIDNPDTIAVIRHAIRNAPPVPLTDDVRVPLDEARSFAGALRRCT